MLLHTQTSGRSDSAALAFSGRHLGVTSPAEQHAMLSEVGYQSLTDLVNAAIPDSIRAAAPLELTGLPRGLAEEEVLTQLRELAALNEVKTSMIGQGFFATHTPAVIRRNLLENPAWYTAYTPYQPEISQGRLEALLNFQTMVADLTALPIANASMLDESSATAEAMLLMRRANRGAGEAAKTVLDSRLYPQTLAVVRGRARALGIKTETVDVLAHGLPEGELSGVILQQPGSDGLVADHSAVIAEAKNRGAMVTVVADLLALTLIVPPGEQGADIAVGNTQRFGVPLFFGGPHAAYISVRDGLERSLPGRLVGVSKDQEGRPAYRLALQTREQHIRREKATSNICTAQALLANTASMYAVYHGPEGLKRIALHAHSMANSLAVALRESDIEVLHDSFFDTVVARVPGRAAEVIAEALRRDVNLRLLDADHVGISTDETTTPAHLAAVAHAFSENTAQALERSFAQSAVQTDRADQPAPTFDAKLVRTSDYLTHPNFNTVRSETQMMRYLRRLSDRDLALDRTMIPLGSCTMKLNAAAEMESISWPEFANIHPYAPAEQTQGWRTLIGRLEQWLIDITGYAGVSLQPNAGSQGELAGLIAIREYHLAQGDTKRDVCLIPASAHGTNAASAVLAGMRVVVVKNTETGAIDLADLDTKIAEHSDRVSAIMITYPSTFGVYDSEVREVCDRVHAAGGQVYIDGANMNALVGLSKPGEFGGDVSHLNLHKTFAIPHGGGGPGVGPVAVAEHLVPYLPGDPLAETSEVGTPVVATIFGSAGVLPISYAYIAMMGAEGLTEATQIALLNANYMAKRLGEHYEILFTGEAGLVAHECILDLRPLTAASGVTAEDVAKRLIDFGFHAPTLAFPVPGTLMVEPTESEDLAEIERFVEAMRVIREEIDEVVAGTYTVDESVLRNAPHPASVLVADEWSRAYPREQAAFAVDSLRVDKYFAPVSRIDGAYGDRNLMCSCPPIDAFEA